MQLNKKAQETESGGYGIMTTLLWVIIAVVAFLILMWIFRNYVFKVLK